MQLTSIYVENFKSFRSKTVFDNLKKVNVFVGANRAGKSNVLLILDFLNKLSRNDTTNIFLDNVFDHDTSKIIKIEIELKLDDSDLDNLSQILIDDNSINNNNNNQLKNLFRQLKFSISVFQHKIIEEKISFKNQSETYQDLIRHIEENGSFNQYVLDIKILSEQANKQDNNIEIEKKNIGLTNTLSLFNIPPEYKTEIYQITNIIITFLRRIVIQKINRSMNFENIDSNKVQSHRNVYPSGENSLYVLSFLRDDNIRKLSEIITEYEDILDIKDIKFPHKNNKIDYVYLDKYLKSEFKFSESSYGSQQLLILFLIINLSENICLCIEEPEIHLHAYHQKKLFEKIKNNNCNVQFFLTTHSPLFTSIGDDVTVYLVTKRKGISNVIPINEDSELKIIKNSLGIENTDIYLSNWIIFVEGASEVHSLRKMGEYAKYNKLKKEINIIPYGGDSKAARLTEFVNYLNQLDIKSIIIGDGHDVTTNVIKNLDRGKKIKYRLRDKDRQFEDLFSNENIVNAMEELYKCSRTTQFDMTLEELNKKRKTQNIAKILNTYLENKGEDKFDKVKLAEKLSELILRELKETNNREQTKFEEELDWIMDTINNEKSVNQI